MMLGCGPLLLLLALASAIAAPSGDLESNPVIIPPKRAALVLDRLLIALQNALRENDAARGRPGSGPRAAPLRVASVDGDMRALQRRGQAAPPARNRVVLRCYFNAITCF